jgi:hypothetical protein
MTKPQITGAVRRCQQNSCKNLSAIIPEKHTNPFQPLKLSGWKIFFGFKQISIDADRILL